MKKRTVLTALLLAVLTLVLPALQSCEAETGEQIRRGAINVGIKSGYGYKVEDPEVVQTVTGGEAAFIITPENGRQIVGFSHADYSADGDEYTFYGLKYSCLIEVYTAVTAAEEPDTTDAGITAETDTVSPDTDEPETEAATTAEPYTTDTEPAETEPQTTEEPTAEPPVTESHITKPPVTKPPVTEAPVTDPPVTYEPVPYDPDREYPTNDPNYANSVIYVFNGAVYKNMAGVGEITVFHDNSHHKRVNTISPVDDLIRRGSTLIGWNTEHDGSGTHIGLGGRTTLNPEGATVLYAEWSDHSPASLFDYKISSGAVTVTSYKGNEKIISIPDKLGGSPVRKIAAGAFTGLGVEKVIFPTTLRTVESSAFTSCSKLTDLYLFDTVTDIKDNSFAKCGSFSTLHINALKPTKYITMCGKTDAYDSLILSDKKCIVFFGGSSCLYGINSYRAREYFNGDYEVINLGWTAPRNAMYQLLIIRSLLEEGDIFVHAPEYLGSYQLLRSVSMGTTAWQLVDSNYDLFALADIRELERVFSSFSEFTSGKNPAKYSTTYDDYCASMDDLGYIIKNRPVKHDKNWAPDGSVKVSASIITDVCYQRLTKYYSELGKKGVTVYLTYPPLDINYLDSESKKPSVRAGYAERYASLGRPVLGDIEDFLYTGDMFYDTEYHLVNSAADMHTDKVVGLLIEQMKADGLWDPDKGGE